MCCGDLCLEPTLACVTGERAPTFTLVELERLVDGVLTQYELLYGPPDQQVSAHQKKGIWCAIAKDVRTLGVYGRWSTHCRKRWEDLGRWAWKTAEAQLGIAFQRGRGSRQTVTPLMARILAVAYLELDGCLRASQQPQGGEYSAHHHNLRRGVSVVQSAADQGVGDSFPGFDGNPLEDFAEHADSVVAGRGDGIDLLSHAESGDGVKSVVEVVLCSCRVFREGEDELSVICVGNYVDVVGLCNVGEGGYVNVEERGAERRSLGNATDDSGGF
ncbi:hypothetical protein NDU88_006121 [Pleurodeles waltl]|uniref:Myb/SANT-like DNA-binding domain-containing protein n=1 Tax=Pleurodeles waltl TaxID=8319 RepID=A0AAV7WFB7_PLEWA|nr:hypothetical protein NDU88_006121 [Pleurodeles waltl]